MIKVNLKRLICRHKNNDVICWHWYHGVNGDSPRMLEIQLKCKDCGKYHFANMQNEIKCKLFVEKYRDKQWSNTCKPKIEGRWKNE